MRTYNPLDFEPKPILTPAQCAEQAELRLQASISHVDYVNLPKGTICSLVLTNGDTIMCSTPHLNDHSAAWQKAYDIAIERFK